MDEQNETSRGEDLEPRPVAVLCVCTGNLCRSPVAERLLAAALGTAVEVSSAGTGAAVGAPVAPPMAHLLTGYGVPSADFAARSLTLPMLRAAELVLTATREHRSFVVEHWPAAVRRTYTLKEFGRLLGAVDPARLDQPTPEQRLRAAIGLAARQRGYAGRADQDDIADPYGREQAAHRAAFSEIAGAVRTISTVLASPLATSIPPDLIGA